MTIDKPGIYTMKAEEYHADPCPKPSLSASIAKELLAQSARHAWWAHPKLNPAFEREDEGKFDVGTAVHAYLLEGESNFAIVAADNWQTNKAKDARAAARLAGQTPLLTEQWERVQEMATAAREQLAVHADPPRPLATGKPEQTIVWREGEIWCRARLDWLHEDRKTIDDYKSTGASANPTAWSRLLLNMDFDVQAAFYLRGLKAVAGVDAIFRFVVQETYKPYALSVIGMTPELLELAERKVRHALAAWSHCLEGNVWPGYPTATCWAELPGWAETQWAEHEAMDSWRRGVVDDGRPLAEQLEGR